MDYTHIASDRRAATDTNLVRCTCAAILKDGKGRRRPSGADEGCGRAGCATGASCALFLSMCNICSDLLSCTRGFLPVMLTTARAMNLPIDMQRKRKQDICYYCKQPGHLKVICPLLAKHTKESGSSIGRFATAADYEASVRQGTKLQP